MNKRKDDVIDRVRSLLESDESAHKIQTYTNVNRSIITRARQTKDVENMRYKNVMALYTYSLRRK
ncbi:hypothetical protein FDG96_gp02 [Bacillus phage Mgbh1]|uniref:Uncharacterized protein n=1 Tax=Bacillus phage Mgbh1 TaxID=1796993 RepID=A0A142F1K4_9CAUD|nr:hypothetical protein FDG96_gp02 [Bacillus phage Mgbh1]AMQ66661.1 hypothetical protein [Bacillus phage Mgbh1]